MRAVLAAAIAVGMAGCQWIPGTPQHRESAFIEAVKTQMDGTLFDYSTARFRDVRVTPRSDTICGEVNSRNRMGAYVGWQKFSAIENPEGGAVILEMGNRGAYGDIKCRVVQEGGMLEGRDLADRMTYKP